MALYSQNNSPILYKDDNTCDVYHPILRHLNVDHVYTWDCEYKDTLLRMGIHSDTTAIGPILWYKDSSIVSKRIRRGLTFCIFDVIPQSRKNLEARGVLSSYYSVENVSLFINDIISATKEVEKYLQCDVHIIMKQKRRPSDQHSKSYALILKSLESNDSFSVLSPDTSLYELADQSDLSISFPFTSSAHVFSFKGKGSIFYDPTMEILGYDGLKDNMYFVSGYQELTATLKVLSEKLQ